MLDLMLEELFDVEEALRELTRQRERLRAAVRAEMGWRGRRIDRPRGSVRIDRRSGLGGIRPSEALPVVAPRGWWDEAFTLNAPGLHRAARRDPEAFALLRIAGAVEQDENVMVVTLRRS